MTTLAQKVKFLSDPASYPLAPTMVEPIETHMSWIFLAGDRVYKFKKPARLPFLDHSTLAARKANCLEELRLNKRLESDIYIRVVPLTRTSSGDLLIDGDGQIVEWLLEMERLPGEQVLDALIAKDKVEPRDIAAIAHKLAAFYQAGPPQIADGPLYLKHLSIEHAVNRKLLTRPEFGLGDDATIAIIDEVGQRFERVRSEIEDRIARGLLVEGHGDLRPEHIYVGSHINIIDCLEFDRSMRILDPYDEVNYLGIECQLQGGGWIRNLLLDTLDKHLKARPSPALMQFYSAFRAVLRARICIAHLLDKKPATPEIWPQRTRIYLDLAKDECVRPHPPAGDGSSHYHEDA